MTTTAMTGSTPGPRDFRRRGTSFLDHQPLGSTPDMAGVKHDVGTSLLECGGDNTGASPSKCKPRVQPSHKFKCSPLVTQGQKTFDDGTPAKAANSAHNCHNNSIVQPSPQQQHPQHPELYHVREVTPPRRGSHWNRVALTEMPSQSHAVDNGFSPHRNPPITNASDTNYYSPVVIHATTPAKHLVPTMVRRQAGLPGRRRAGRGGDTIVSTSTTTGSTSSQENHHGRGATTSSLDICSTDSLTDCSTTSSSDEAGGRRSHDGGSLSSIASLPSHGGGDTACGSHRKRRSGRQAPQQDMFRQGNGHHHPTEGGPRNGSSTLSSVASFGGSAAYTTATPNYVRTSRRLQYSHSFDPSMTANSPCPPGCVAGPHGGTPQRMASFHRTSNSGSSFHEQLEGTPTAPWSASTSNNARLGHSTPNGGNGPPIGKDKKVNVHKLVNLIFITAGAVWILFTMTVPAWLLQSGAMPTTGVVHWSLPPPPSSPSAFDLAGPTAARTKIVRGGIDHLSNGGRSSRSGADGGHQGRIQSHLSAEALTSSGLPLWEDRYHPRVTIVEFPSEEQSVPTQKDDSEGGPESSTGKEGRGKPKLKKSLGASVVHKGLNGRPVFIPPPKALPSSSASSPRFDGDRASDGRRQIVQYPTEFSDNTQLYPVLDSSDEALSRMERRAPYSEGECVPMQSWQTTYHPTCNGLHEMDLGGVDDVQVLFGTKGFWRDAWRVENEEVSVLEDDFNVVSSTRKAVLKTMKYGHNFEDDFYEHNRVDAVAMERLTASPHVMNIYNFCGQSGITEFADGPRIGTRADKTKGLDKLRIAKDLASGLADLHSIDGEDNATFVHFDVNLANMVIANDTIKLNDFNIGILRKWNTTSNEPCGFPSKYPNPQWRSPEEARNSQHLTEKVDVFSMGHVFFRLICGHEPWNKLEPDGRPSKEAVNDRVKSGGLPHVPDSVKKSTDYTTVAIREAMMKCYTFDPKKRPSARSIANDLSSALEMGEMSKELNRALHTTGVSSELNKALQTLVRSENQHSKKTRETTSTQKKKVGEANKKPTDQQKSEGGDAKNQNKPSRTKKERKRK